MKVEEDISSGESDKAEAGPEEVEKRVEIDLRVSELAAARALVRDVIAEELERFWERRFGGRA
jgi:hypothetical protein